MDEDPSYVTCPECGHEQPDMGTRVRCEACGHGPMPTHAPGTGNEQKEFMALTPGTWYVESIRSGYLIRSTSGDKVVRGAGGFGSHVDAFACAAVPELIFFLQSAMKALGSHEVPAFSRSEEMLFERGNELMRRLDGVRHIPGWPYIQKGE